MLYFAFIIIIYLIATTIICTFIITHSISVFLIDQQQGFAQKGEPLYVEGAENDEIKLISFLKSHTEFISNYFTSRDYHPKLHIGDSEYWLTDDGINPDVFTEISPDDYFSRKYIPLNTENLPWCNYYFGELKNKNKTHTIWPPHCKENTESSDYSKKLKSFFNTNNINVKEKLKGTGKSEQYSAFLAEVIDPSDDSTRFDYKLFNSLIANDLIFFSGQAKSHCVRQTVEDFLQHYTKLNNYKPIVVILEDTMSNVPGFESIGDKFLKDINEIDGVEVISTQNVDMNKLRYKVYINKINFYIPTLSFLIALFIFSIAFFVEKKSKED